MISTARYLLLSSAPSDFLFASHAKPHGPTTLLHRRIPLHLLANPHVHIKELRHASIQAHRLPLVEISFAIVRRYAFFGAGLDEARKDAVS